MARLDRFARTLLFGALAGLSLPAAWLLLAPVLGAGLALGLYLAGAVTLYVAWIAPDRRSAAAAVGTAAFLAAGVLSLAATPGELALGMGGVLGVVRSGLLFRSRPLRAIALECTLLSGGLALAALLASPGALGAALGLWAFFLVQSVFFLVGGVVRRNAASGERDAFDQARARIASLLEDA